MSPNRTNPWLVCLLPFFVFMLVGTLEPAAPIAGEEVTAPWHGIVIEYRHYPLVYAAKIGMTIAAMIFVMPGYRQFAWRWSWLAVVVGVVGAVAWIVLAQLQHFAVKQIDLPSWLSSLGRRSGFNPLEQLRDNPALAYGFLAVRLIGLVIVVPIIEEFFLRGFLMRFVMAERWWEVPFGTVNRNAIIAGTLVPVLLHPQEAAAALVWFSAVTWLMIRTRSIWACIAAHAITNLLLGIYVIDSGEWWLL